MPINKDFFTGKKVLITGGAGFIGSSLAHALVDLKADVTVLDAMLPLYGGNLFNLEGIIDKIKFVEGDIRDRELVNDLVRGQDFIFDLAAQVSYIDSKDLPFLDIDINGLGHMNVLEAMRLYAPSATYFFSSSRMVYGKLLTNPVPEDHPTRPLSLYGIHKLLVENYCDYYHKTFGLKTVVVRLPNPYGIRQQMKHNKYSLVGWFLRQAFDGGIITIFGDGEQQRDYLYIDDIVEGLLLLSEKGTPGDIYNMGSEERVTFRQMVDTLLEEVKRGKKEHVPWPENYEKNETGDFFADIKKINQDTGWKAKTSLQEGIRKMVQYYHKNRGMYWLSGGASIELAVRDYVNKKFSDLGDRDKEAFVSKQLEKLRSGSGAANDLEKIVNTIKNKKILDAGSGFGLVSLGLARKSAQVIGVEEDKTLVSLAQYIAQANDQKINFLYSSLNELPFPNESFDIVVSVNVLNRIQDRHCYLQEVLRVLKPGGVVYLSFPTKSGELVNTTGSYSYYDLAREIKSLSTKHGQFKSDEGVPSVGSKLKTAIKSILLSQTVLTLVKK